MCANCEYAKIDNIAEIAADILSPSPVSDEIIASCTSLPPYPINQFGRSQYDAETIWECEDKEVADLFYRIVLPHYEGYEKHRQAVSDMEDAERRRYIQQVKSRDFAISALSPYASLNWFCEDVTEAVKFASAHTYAVATSPDMVLIAEELGMCTTKKSRTTLPFALMFSPEYIESSEEVSELEKRLSKVCYKMFDERDHPNMFEIVGHDDTGRPCIAMKQHAPTIGICRQEIALLAKNALDLPRYPVPIAFAEAHEGRDDAGLASAVIPMLALPSDPPEVRQYIRNLAVCDVPTHARASILHSPATPPIIAELVRRAQVLPSLYAYTEIRKIAEDRKEDMDCALFSYGERLSCLCAQATDTLAVEEIMDYYDDMYKTYNFESYLDTIAAGVPIEDLLG